MAFRCQHTMILGWSLVSSMLAEYMIEVILWLFVARKSWSLAAAQHHFSSLISARKLSGMGWTNRNSVKHREYHKVQLRLQIKGQNLRMSNLCLSKFCKINMLTKLVWIREIRWIFMQALDCFSEYVLGCCSSLYQRATVSCFYDADATIHFTHLFWDVR